MCPLIQNDILPHEPVAWRQRFARLDRAEEARLSKGWMCSGAAIEVKVLQCIMKLFVYVKALCISHAWPKKESLAGGT